MTLESVAENVWAAAAPHSMLGLRIGARMTVVRLRDGALWVHSPVALDPALRAAIDALGAVRHVVAPNLYHHMYAAEFQRAYPDATLHAPAELIRKRPDLRVDATLSAAPHPEWAADLWPHPIAGSDLRETVFVHPRTRTVISADLTENFETSDHWPTRVYLKASGTHGKVGWPRPLRFLYKDHAAARRSLDALLEHDFDRVIVAHGRIIERDGKAAVRATFAGWL